MQLRLWRFLWIVPCLPLAVLAILYVYGDAKTGKRTKTLVGHKGTVRSLTFSPDGKTLASGSLDKTIHLWNVKTRKHTITFTGHKAAVEHLAFSPGW